MVQRDEFMPNYGTRHSAGSSSCHPPESDGMNAIYRREASAVVVDGETPGKDRPPSAQVKYEMPCLYHSY